MNPNAIRAARDSGVYGCNSEIDQAIDEYLRAVVEGKFDDCEDFMPPDDPQVIAAQIEHAFDDDIKIAACETSRKKNLVLDLDKNDDEYTVVWIEDGQIDGKNCYFTDWLDDAIATREDMKKRAEAKGFTVTLTESIDIAKEKKQ